MRRDISAVLSFRRRGGIDEIRARSNLAFPYIVRERREREREKGAKGESQKISWHHLIAISPRVNKQHI